VRPDQVRLYNRVLKAKRRRQGTLGCYLTGIGMRKGAPGTPVVSGCGIVDEVAPRGDTRAAIGETSLQYKYMSEK
jgi:hypothetical protein